MTSGFVKTHETGGRVAETTRLSNEQFKGFLKIDEACKVHVE